MDKRYLVVAAALLLAGGVLAGAYYLGGPGASQHAAERGQRVADGAAPELATLPAVDRASLGNAEATPIYGVDNFDIFVDDGETVTRLRGSRANPRENFISDVEKPVAEVAFSATRLLVISADSGTFYHPGNVPQRGEFHRNTVLTLYEAPADTPLDTVDPKQVQLRLYLDGVTSFNREEGIVSTEGPVRLVRPDADFTGRGLDLTYNNLTQRIERMVIHHADELRLAVPQDADVEPASPRVDAAPPPAPVARASAPTRGREGARESSPPPGEARAEPTYYQAVMNDRVRLRGSDARLAGDTLTVLFSLSPASPEASGGTDSAPPGAPPAEGTVAAGAPAPDGSNTPPAEPGPQGSPGPNATAHADPRSLLIPSADDMVIHWDGRLVLTPLDAAPAALAGPGDARFVLEGRPGRLDTEQDEHVTAAELGYATADGRVFARSDGATPLTLTTPDLGTLTGSSLWLEMGRDRGQVAGPGRLDAPEHRLAVSFAERLDLTFAGGAAGGAAELESAAFVGQVHAVAAGDSAEEQLDLRADGLTLSMERPASAADEPEPDATPSRLLATGNVRALRPGSRLAADRLDIELSPPASRPEPAVAGAAGEGAAERGVEIARLRAMENVRVELTEDATVLTAHALDADPRASRLELFGHGETDATLDRDNASLAGRHLILLEEAQTADVLGPGTFTTQLDPETPDERLVVKWERFMAFDNRSGRANFLGRVDATSTTATDDTRLQAHDLSLNFDPQALSQQDPDPPAASGQRPAAPVALRHALATAIPGDAESEVTFSARTYAPAPGSIEADQPREAVTRLTVIGPRLTFTNEPPNLEDDSRVNDHIAVERVVVDGKGKMLLEDFRPLPEDAQTSGGGDSTGVLLAGPGVTLFAWTDRLTLDAQANDMLIEGDVWMVHKPLDDSAGEPIKLDAQRLLADLTETGGLGAWVGEAAPTARVRQIDADGAVRVTQGDFNVVSDHLRYVEAERNVLLWADPGRGVTLTRDDQPDGSTTAAALKWDLDTNVFRGINPDSGVIPLR